jgi:hypothetical protein
MTRKKGGWGWGKGVNKGEEEALESVVGGLLGSWATTDWDCASFFSR